MSEIFVGLRNSKISKPGEFYEIKNEMYVFQGKKLIRVQINEQNSSDQASLFVNDELDNYTSDVLFKLEPGKLYIQHTKLVSTTRNYNTKIEYIKLMNEKYVSLPLVDNELKSAGLGEISEIVIDGREFSEDEFEKILKIANFVKPEKSGNKW